MPATPVAREDARNTVGAGDTAFAAFLLSYAVLGWPLRESAKLAMQLAAAKLKENGTVLGRPLEALQAMDRTLAQRLKEALQGNIRFF